MITIKSLGSLNYDTLYATFNEAFGSYEVQVNKEELKVMLTRRGFVPDLSFGAFENEKLISFTLNGIGMFNNIKTAYDTGTGTLKEHRGKGIASEIFRYSLPFLEKAGITQYLLEVLQHNTSAVSVYEKLGFIVSREFNYFSQLSTEVSLQSKSLPDSYLIREMNLTDKDLFMPFWDFVPSWQNGFESILRTVDDFRMWGVYEGMQLLGYCIFEPGSGDVTQLAVSRKYRRQGIATVLLDIALRCNRHQSIKIVNTDSSCEEMNAFLNSNSIFLKGKQFEMIKKLQ